MSANVAIIIVNWNGWADTIACVRSCLALDHDHRRIVVCDNASSDRSVERILAWARGEEVPVDPASPMPLDVERRPAGVALLDRAAAEAGQDGEGAELLIVRTGGNLGFAGGNNVGLRWARARGMDAAWLLNNDAVADRHALSALLAAAAAPGVGLVGSVLLDYEAPQRVQALAGAMRLDTFAGRHVGDALPVTVLEDAERIASLLRPPAGDIVYPVGASLLVTGALLEEVGLMNEEYFLYYEEADWVLRARPRFRVEIAPASRVYHKHGASAGSTPDGRSARSSSFLYRSRLLAVRRFAPERLNAARIAIAVEGLKGVLRGRPGRARGAWAALTDRVAVPVPSEAP